MSYITENPRDGFRSKLAKIIGYMQLSFPEVYSKIRSLEHYYFNRFDVIFHEIRLIFMVDINISHRNRLCITL